MELINFRNIESKLEFLDGARCIRDSLQTTDASSMASVVDCFREDTRLL